MIKLAVSGVTRRVNCDCGSVLEKAVICFAASLAIALIVATTAAAQSDSSLFDMSQLAPPPKSVGIAYETNPPPLESLTGILGTRPSRDGLDLFVSSFARVVFEPENSQRYPWIVKWKRGVRINLIGDVETRHHELLEQVVGDLTNITGLPMRIIDRPERLFGAPILIHVRGDLDTFRDGACGLAKPIVYTDGGLLNQQMVVSTAVRGDSLVGCFYEDISQALGLYGDNALAEESMYRSQAENKLWQKPTWHDVIMLRTLYDRRIKPGMHEDQAMPLVRVIIAELLEELNASVE
jgi:hypothetical protein